MDTAEHRRQLRILHVVGPSEGGIRRHVDTLVKSQIKSGMSTKTNRPMFEDSSFSIDPQIQVSGNPLKAWRTRRELRKAFRDYDVIHAHGLKAGWIASTISQRPPLIITIHNLVLPSEPWPKGFILRRMESSLFRRRAFFITPSHQIRNRVRSANSEAPTQVVYVTSPQPVVDRSRRDVRTQWGVPDESPVAVCVARLHKQKDLPALLKATREVVDIHPNFVLVLVGSGPEEHSLKQLAKELEVSNSVKLVGHSSNPANEMNASDVVVLSSIWEANPIVGYEARALGRPFVATAVGELPYVIRHRETGMLVPRQSPTELAKAISEVLSDNELAKRLSIEGQKSAEALMDMDSLAGQVTDIYEKVIQGARSGRD